MVFCPLFLVSFLTSIQVLGNGFGLVTGTGISDGHILKACYCERFFDYFTMYCSFLVR